MLLKWLVRSATGTALCSLLPVCAVLFTWWLGRVISAPEPSWMLAVILGLAFVAGCGLAYKLGYYDSDNA